MSQDLIGPLLLSMLGCASAALDPPVGRAVVAPGTEAVADDCCAGQVWVRLVGATPVYPSAGQGAGCAPVMWTISVMVGVLRCAAVLDDAGNAPSVEALNADSAQESADMAALSEAIQCCMSQLVSRLTLGGWSPLGPEGGCVGGEWSLTTVVDNCRCP